MRRRLTRREKKRKKIIIFSITSIICLFSAGYATFSSNFLLSGKGTIVEKGKTPKELKEEFCNETSTEGLYLDEFEESKCVFKGDDPNNYLNFNNEVWRIISIESDNSLKIIKNEPLENELAYDTSNQTGFENSTLSIYLNNDYYNSLIERDKIIPKNFYSGMLEGGRVDKSISEIINLEKQEIYNGKIGLLSFSDYMRGSTNDRCISFVDARPITENSPCHLDNYLHTFKDIGGLWILNSVSAEQAYCIWNEKENYTHPYTISYYNKNRNSHESTNALFKVQPVLFLDNSITLTGKGTKEKPYKIS